MFGLLGSFFGTDSGPSSYLSGDYARDYRFTIDLSKDTLTREVNFTDLDVGRYKASFLLWYGEKKLINFSQTGGKKCGNLSKVVIDDFTYIKCDFEKTEFLEGDYVSLKVVSKCGDSCWKRGVDTYLYPASIRGAEGETNVESVMILPKGYSLFNSSAKGYSVREVGDRIIVTLKNDLEYGVSLIELYNNNLFFHFKKKVDFSRMKEYRVGIIRVLYPTGFEEESFGMLNQLNQILTEFKGYAGQGAFFREITFRMVVNESVINGYCAHAFAAKTPGGLDSVNISINCISGNTPFHELCHIAEKPLDYPSWFSEGQATNCGEIDFMNLLGREDEAEKADGQRTNDSKLTANVKLPDWKPANVTSTEDNYTRKGYGLAYVMMKEVLPYVDMPLFYAKMRERYRGTWQLPDDAVICTLNEAATSNVLPIFEKYGFRVDCSKVTLCQRDEILDKDGNCVERCGTFCLSDRISIKSEVCPEGQGYYQGRCQRPCYFEDDTYFYCRSGDYCYKNKCWASCEKIGPEYELYEDGYCYPVY